MELAFQNLFQGCHFILIISTPKEKHFYYSPKGTILSGELWVKQPRPDWELHNGEEHSILEITRQRDSCGNTWEAASHSPLEPVGQQL